MTTMSDIDAPAGQDEVENRDRFDNLQDADTLADLNGLEPPAGPRLNPVDEDDGDDTTLDPSAPDPIPGEPDDTDDEDSPALDDRLDDQPDGDRQLTTESDAIDSGLNDSDLGADVAGLSPERQDAPEREGYAGLGPDAPRTGGDPTGDRATGLTGTRE